MEKYTRLTRFIRVEELQETYFTKKLNNVQNDDLESKFEKVWTTLDKEYFVKEEVTEKLDILTKSVQDTYSTITSHKELDENTDSRFASMKEQLTNQEDEVINLTDDIKDINRRVKNKSE